MNETEFKRVYNESRNGCNNFVRHPLARNFAYTDGVQELAETGCYWLLDVLATELPTKMRKASAASAMVSVKVSAGKARITAEFVDGQVAWTKKIDYTDLPDGDWKFYVADEMDGATPFRMILISEY
jgi:hypothetical protein